MSGKKQFETSVRVPKRALDPFGQRAQAERLAKSEARLPRNRGRVNTVEYETTDRGDHYEVTIKGYSGGSGPRDTRDGNGAPGVELPGAAADRASEARGAGGDPGFSMGMGRSTGTEEGSWLTPSGPDAGMDVRGAIESSYSIAELRQIASRLDVSYPQTASKRRIAQRIVEQEPRAAHGLVY